MRFRIRSSIPSAIAFPVSQSASNRETPSVPFRTSTHQLLLTLPSYPTLNLSVLERTCGAGI